MRRREFITLLGGAGPLAARAQQPDRIRRIGVFMHFASGDAEGQARIGAFLQGLQELGWAIGSNVQIDYRWSAGDPERGRRDAAELLALAPDVILATGGATLGPLHQATRTVPIVFMLIPDPVGAGFVENLARPGGNLTGFAVFEYGFGTKYVELLKEIAPRVTRVAVLRDSATTSETGQFAAIQAVAPSFGLEVIPLNARGRRDRASRHIIRAFLEWRSDRNGERFGGS
jgi:putative tryptophan/tyrosine transport system substrate-binding protein